MGKYTMVSLLFLLVTLTHLLPSFACPYCPTPTHPPPPPPKLSPPPPPPPPKLSPPPPPKACPPPPPPKPKPCPPPPPPKPEPCPPPPPHEATCPIDTLKLDACVDLLGGLVHILIGDATSTCCPVLDGLADLDAVLCLCTTIRAKLLDINILLPVALELLVDCGKNPPQGYQCPA